MTFNSRSLVYLGLVGLLAACQAGVSSEDSQAAAIASIDGDSIRSHMEVLAADDMQGREAGSKHYQAAADYVAEQYQQAGLEPMGDAGSYFQSIEFLETRLVPGRAEALDEPLGKGVEPAGRVDDDRDRRAAGGRSRASAGARRPGSGREAKRPWQDVRRDQPRA